jgi:hypothetical protein
MIEEFLDQLSHTLAPIRPNIQLYNTNRSFGNIHKEILELYELEDNVIQFAYTERKHAPHCVITSQGV